MAISIRPKRRGDVEGFHIGGRPKGAAYSGIFPFSIFVRCRSTAVRIKKLLNSTPERPTPAQWSARTKKMDMLMRADARVKVCRR